MDTPTFIKVIETLQRESSKWDPPLMSLIAVRTRAPYWVLISTLLSSRTKDDVTGEATRRLFSLADTPQKMVQVPIETIEKTIYPVGFYRQKARRIVEISNILLKKYGGQVPESLEELLKLPGVGRKTANLVLSEAFGIPAICVDTHVHRICNRLGYVSTRSPRETEFELRKKLPTPWWIPLNKILVSFGQSICKPIRPRCEVCPVINMCERIGLNEPPVEKRRGEKF